jgi:hypothetical protein
MHVGCTWAARGLLLTTEWRLVFACACEQADLWSLAMTIFVVVKHVPETVGILRL